MSPNPFLKDGKGNLGAKECTHTQTQTQTQTHTTLSPGKNDFYMLGIK